MFTLKNLARKGLNVPLITIHILYIQKWKYNAAILNNNTDILMENSCISKTSTR